MKKAKSAPHRVIMTEGKREIISKLLSEYDVKTAKDIQEALKDLLGGTIKEMLEAEMDSHLGYRRSQRSDSSNARNGHKSKNVKSGCGEIEIEVPQDRQSTFEPQVVKKRQKDISEIEGKIIAMYSKGMTTRQISDTVQDIYGFDVSEGFISNVTDKLMPRIEEWRKRPLSECYPIVFIDAIHYSVRESNMVVKRAAYIILGINHEGCKEALGIAIGENESAKDWLSLLNELKGRGVKDILILCSDGLSGIREAIAAAYPDTEYQRCVVHQVRNTLKYVAYKDYKELVQDLKSIYLASSEETAFSNLSAAKEKWNAQYPNIMNSWEKNWDSLCPIFKFSKEVRRAFYTTNAIESLNASYRKINRQRSVFPNGDSLLKTLYLTTVEQSKKWNTAIRNWGKIRAELSIMYENRLPE